MHCTATLKHPYVHQIILIHAYVLYSGTTWTILLESNSGCRRPGGTFPAMLRQGSLPPADRAFEAPGGNPFLYQSGLLGGEVFPRKCFVGPSWTWRPCYEEVFARRRWTQPVSGSEREPAVVGRSSLPAPSYMPGQNAFPPLVVTPRTPRDSQPSTPIGAPRSASVGALQLSARPEPSAIHPGIVQMPPSAGLHRCAVGALSAMQSEVDRIQLMVTPRGLTDYSQPSTPVAVTTRSASVGALRLPVHCPERGHLGQTPTTGAQPMDVGRRQHYAAETVPVQPETATRPLAASGAASLQNWSCNESWA